MLVQLDLHYLHLSVCNKQYTMFKLYIKNKIMFVFVRLGLDNLVKSSINGTNLKNEL